MKKIIFLMIVVFALPVFGGNQELRQSTQQFITLPNVASITSAVTPITTLLLSAADSAVIIKQGTTTVTDISSFALASITGSSGTYVITATASATDTLGNLTVIIIDADVCTPIWEYCSVLPANVWDSKYSTDYLQVDAVQLLGTAYSAPTTPGVQEVDITYVNGNAFPTSAANVFNDLASTTTAAAEFWSYTGSRTISDFDEDDMNIDLDSTTILSSLTAANIWTYAGSRTVTDFDEDDMTIDLDNTIAVATWTYAGSRTITDLDEDDVHIDLDSTAVLASGSAAFDSTTVTSATSASVFVIADGVIQDDVYNGFLITVTDADGDNDPEPGLIKDYVSSTKTITLANTLSFTPANGDTVCFYADLSYYIDLIYKSIALTR